MTTPNIEELIDRLRDPQTRGTTGEWFDRAVAADALQSQAERIKELEAVNKLLSGIQENTEEENRALRAQLAAIAATEPVAWFFTDIQSGDQEADTDPDSYTREVATGYKRKQPLFTRPMPADVTELVKDAERWRFTMWWQDQNPRPESIQNCLTDIHRWARARGALGPNSEELQQATDAAITNAKGAK